MKEVIETIKVSGVIIVVIAALVFVVYWLAVFNNKCNYSVKYKSWVKSDIEKVMAEHVMKYHGEQK